LHLPIDSKIPEGRNVRIDFAVASASVSVASNIAEGRGRLNNGEFRQFLGVALGSIFEVKTQLIVARRLEMAKPVAIDEATSLSEEVSKMLTSFIQTLSSKPGHRAES
jgi:four helix bundle protein